MSSFFNLTCGNEDLKALSMYIFIVQDLPFGAKVARKLLPMILRDPFLNNVFSLGA